MTPAHPTNRPPNYPTNTLYDWDTDEVVEVEGGQETLRARYSEDKIKVQLSVRIPVSTSRRLDAYLDVINNVDPETIRIDAASWAKSKTDVVAEALEDWLSSHIVRRRKVLPKRNAPERPPTEVPALKRKPNPRRKEVI